MKDRNSECESFDFGTVPEAPSQTETEARHHPALVATANSEVYVGYRNVISAGENFRQAHDSSWPLAEFNTSTSGVVRVQLRPETDEPLLPEEQDAISQRLFERSKKFSEIEADLCDILMSNWLKDAKSLNHRATIETDDLCRRRGLQPKLGGGGHRGGYSPEQRLTHLIAAKSIFDSWIITREAPVYKRGKRQPISLRCLESRPFVVTDRVGDHRFSWSDSACHDNYVDVRAFKYVVGEAFGAYLIANRQTALLSERALNYSAKQWWEKRLTRYYSYLWRCRARTGSFSKPIKVSTIFAEGLRLEIDNRRLARTKDHFLSCHRNLQRDAVISGWRYQGQVGPWPDWAITIDPPAEILQHYGPLMRGHQSTQPQENLPPEVRQLVGEQIRQKRLGAGLSQLSLAQQLGISQAVVSKVESGCAAAPNSLREWLAG